MIDITKLKPSSYRAFKKQAIDVQNSTMEQLCTKVSSQVVPVMSLLVGMANLMDNDESINVKKPSKAAITRACATKARRFEHAINKMDFSCKNHELRLPQKEIANALDACEVKPTSDDKIITSIATMTACTMASIMRLSGDKRIADCVKNNESFIGAMAELVPVLAIGAANMSDAIDNL